MDQFLRRYDTESLGEVIEGMNKEGGWGKKGATAFLDTF